MSRITQATRRPWTPAADREARLASAVRIAEWVVGEPELHELHRRELLSIATWKATEIDGKWRTRFRSTGVIQGVTGTSINHEHVVTRLALRQLMLANPEEIGAVMALAVGCLVTRDEHRRLDEAAGLSWDRYISASIDVVDMSDGSLLDLSVEARRWNRLMEGLSPREVDPHGRRL